MLPANKTTSLALSTTCLSFPVEDCKKAVTIKFSLDRRAGKINREINLKAEKEFD
jgi:hypothetical protein